MADLWIESPLIQRHESFPAFHLDEIFCMGDGVGGGIGIDIDDLTSPTHDLCGNIIVGGHSTGTADQDGQVDGSARKVAEIRFLFWVTDILPIAEH